MKISKILIIFTILMTQASANECYTPQDYLAGIQRFLEAGERISSCTPLNIGDAKINNTRIGSRVRAEHGGERYDAPNASQYLLRRVSEDTYDVVFNLDFNRTDQATVSEAQMLQRVQRCLSISSESLFSSSGKKIRLVALSPDQSEASSLVPPEININIIEPGNRGNAENYASDFNCATITHELLHFLGLCDEYQEDPNNTAESQCRALGPNDSIMGASMNDVFANSVGEISSCDLSNNANVKNALNSSDPTLKQAAIRKRHVDVLSFSGPDIGLPQSENPFTLFCEYASGSNVNVFEPTDANAPFTKIDSINDTSLTTSSYVLNASGSGAFTTTVNCNCNKPAESYRAACEKFMYLAKFRLESISREGSKIYYCPFYPGQVPVYNEDGTPKLKSDESPEMALAQVSSRVPIQDLDIQPGAFNLKGDIVSFRDQPRQERSSILYDAHFEKILQGSCVAENMNPMVEKYNNCARFSRSHSMEGKSCSDRPSYCDGFGWLGSSNN